MDSFGGCGWGERRYIKDFSRGLLKLLVFVCFTCISIIFGSKPRQRVKLRGASVKVELRRGKYLLFFFFEEGKVSSIIHVL